MSSPLRIAEREGPNPKDWEGEVVVLGRRLLRRGLEGGLRRGGGHAPWLAAVTEHQPVAQRHVIADADRHHVYLFRPRDGVGVVVAVDPVGDPDIAAMIEQFDKIKRHGMTMTGGGRP